MSDLVELSCNQPTIRGY